MKINETVHAENRYSTDSPLFRVNFWERHGSDGWNLQAFVLSDAANVIEAIDWINEHKGGRTVELFAEVDDEPIHAFGVPRSADLVRLLGSNPNE